MPFGPYEDFDACVEDNQDKDDPKAFCGWLKHRIEGSAEPSVVLTYRDKLALATISLDKDEHGYGSYPRSERDIAIADRSQKVTAQTGSPAFKQWFGNWQDPHAYTSTRDPKTLPVSQAVNPDGSPRVFYHGTQGAHNVLLPGQPGKNSSVFGDWDTSRSAIFFAETPEHADAFTTQGGSAKGGNIIPAYLQVMAPLDLTKGVSDDVIDELSAAGGLSRGWLRSSLGRWEMFDDDDGNALVSTLKKAGYDSVIFNDQNPETRDDVTTWAVFDPTQAKSAIGNKGTFDPKNPDLTLSYRARMALLLDKDEHGWGSYKQGEWPGEKQTDTPAFKKWFGESRVVDRKGQPLRVYHGTTADFTAFQSKGGGKSGRVWFAADPDYADIYAKGADHQPMMPGARILPLYAALKNPLVFQDTREGRGEWANSPTDQELERKGHDGVLFKSAGNVVTGYAFQPTSVKSAIGNKGTFDPENPDLTLSSMFRLDKDEHGYGSYKQGEGPDAGHVFFHGTNEQSVRSILKDGLLAKHSGHIWPGQSEQGKVYVTTDEATALEWAQYSGQTQGIADSSDTADSHRFPQPVAILKVRIPDEQMGQLAGDTHSTYDPVNRQFTGDIPPAWIVGAKLGRPSKPDATVWDVEYHWEDVHLRAGGQVVYVVLRGQSPTPTRLSSTLSSTLNLPDVADVNFPSMIGAIPAMKPRRKKRRYAFKGVSLSRAPMKFEMQVLALAEIPKRLDLARDTLVATTHDDEVLRRTMADIAQYGATEVMMELVRQGAPASVGMSAPTVNINDVYAALVADRERALRDLKGDYEYKLCRRRIAPARRDVLATELAERRRPSLLKRFANRAVNEAFAFGRAASMAQVRRQHLPVEFALAHSKPDKVSSGELSVDAVVQTAVMDTNTCDECGDVDGEVMDFGSDRQEELHPPYVKCLGGDYCRCVQIALLSDGSEIDVDEVDEDTLPSDDKEDNF